jgi:hypothetical protein
MSRRSDYSSANFKVFACQEIRFKPMHVGLFRLLQRQTLTSIEVDRCAKNLLALKPVDDYSSANFKSCIGNEIRRKCARPIIPAPKISLDAT